MLRPCNARGRQVLLELFELAERDGFNGYLRLDYYLLQDLMRDADCTQIDRAKIRDVWTELRNRDIERIEKDRESGSGEWKKEMGDFLSEKTGGAGTRR